MQSTASFKYDTPPTPVSVAFADSGSGVVSASAVTERATPSDAGMTREAGPVRVAVIGAGVSGSACAAGLRRAGADVTLFDEGHHVGGRTATTRANWIDAAGATHSVAFDHGAHGFAPVRPRFKAAMARALAIGSVSRWQPRVHAARLGRAGACLVATPTMPALCEHLLGDAPVLLEHTVRRLQRAAAGGWYVVADAAPTAGPFHHVVLATPPSQAAVLLAGHQDAWAEALIAKRMEPCWTLMAVTDDVDWPWDAAVPFRGPLAWVLRNDRVPGRVSPSGVAVWTAHATAEWSAAHLEDDSNAVVEALRSALRAQMPTASHGSPPILWHHADVHRWRQAGPSVDCDDSFDSDEFLWSRSGGIGVCGDFLAGGGVEAAWHSGDELADSMAASFERTEAEALAAIGAG